MNPTSAAVSAVFLGTELRPRSSRIKVKRVPQLRDLHSDNACEIVGCLTKEGEEEEQAGG